MDCRVKPGNDGKSRFPGAMQHAAVLRRDASLNRDRNGHRALYGPGSAAHRSARATRCAASGEHAELKRRVCCIGLVMNHTVSQLTSIVREIADEMAQRSDHGEVASYIPELASVHNRRFGLVVIDAAGNVAAAGDSEMPFQIQSISKGFPLTLGGGL